MKTSARSAQMQQRLACRRLLHVENEAALVAIQLQIERPHIGAAGRSDAPTHEVALRRLDLDDIGAVVGENLRGVRSEDPLFPKSRLPVFSLLFVFEEIT